VGGQVLVVKNGRTGLQRHEKMTTVLRRIYRLKNTVSADDDDDDDDDDDEEEEDEGKDAVFTCPPS
jgi:hypothetical protein